MISRNLLITFILFLLAKNGFANEKNTFNFEIRRQKTPTEQYINHGHHFGRKFQEMMEKPEPRNNDSIALYRFLDDEFYGEIVIGHPGQKLNVAFDTTWSYSWVISSKCSSIKSIGCYFHNKYDHSKSSEYKKDGRPFAMDLGSYNLTGFYSYDNISIAHSNVTGQSFVEMVYVPNQFVFNKADGVMGLGLKTDENYDPFFYTLLKQKKIKNPIFSIYLNRDRQSNRGGNVMLGFVDLKHVHKAKVGKKIVYDNFTYLPVENYAYWQFQMDQVVVKVGKDNNVVVCEKGCKAIVDTSSNAIIGPQADIDQIHDVINAREFFLHRYTLDCDTVNKLPKIDFMLGGKNFTLSGPDYTVKMSYHSITICLSAFIPANTIQEQDRWILGGAFLAEFYTVYDVQARTIGFVKTN
ncbi:aspartic proteinase A2-like [Tribolium madens]|uniref:aspartic proteinase A2-like n=1 Tax=Tribolium madens TaxID=41895 RepID=UPI001CF71EEC|nr:aspartic proteinase A2-like [Tribolium madens]